METTVQVGSQGMQTLQATEEEKDPKSKEDMIAFVDREQFTKEEAIVWLQVEEESALAIARDSDMRGVGGAHRAHIRAEACAKLRVKIGKAKGKKTWDLNAELGTIQDRILVKEGIAQPTPETTTFQGIGEL